MVLLLISATTLDKNDDALYKSIQGTWELESFYNYDELGNITDTVMKAPGYRQVKMFYNGKIMWSRYVPNEPEGHFGYGMYKVYDNELHETIIYGDVAMMKALDTITEFVFDLDLKKNSYSQISTDENGIPTFSENYKRLD